LQVFHAHVFRNIVVSAQAQAVHGVDITVPGGKENNGQCSGQGAQVLAQGKPAFGLIAETDVDNGRVGQAPAQYLPGRGAVAISGYTVAPALEGVAVIVADGGFVLYQGKVFLHLSGDYPWIMSLYL